VFWVKSVYFNKRNTLPKSGTFLLGHPVYMYTVYVYQQLQLVKARERVRQPREVRMAPGCACEGPANCLKLDDEYGQAM
jgi:hypothetical protein